LFNDSSVEMASVASTNLTGDDLTNPNIVKVYLDDNNYALILKEIFLYKTNNIFVILVFMHIVVKY